MGEKISIAAAEPLRRSAGDLQVLNFVHRSLDSIRNEVSRGTSVDPQIVSEIEASLAKVERDRP